MPSRREQIRLTPEEVDAFLRGRRTMNIATHNHDGSIHLVAMWYGFYRGNPAFETFAKSQKVQNLRRDPRITVLLEEGDRYEELRGVELVGTAVIHDDPDVLREVARDVVRRYWNAANDEELDVMTEGLMRKRVAVEIVAERVVSWDHGKLGGTY